MPARRGGWILFAALALGSGLADLATKEWIFSTLGMPGKNHGIDIIPGVLALETNLNEGALFGLGQGFGALFAAISVIAMIGIVAMVSRPSARGDLRLVAALGLIGGGILGNLYDRLGLAGLTWEEPAARAGLPVIAVRDWIHFHLEGLIDWPVFNLADTWLVIGAVGLIWVSLWPASPALLTDIDMPGEIPSSPPAAHPAERSLDAAPASAAPEAL